MSTVPPVHVQCMKVEADELCEKLDTLSDFLVWHIHPELSLQKRALLTDQYKYMEQYLNVLAERIMLETE